MMVTMILLKKQYNDYNDDSNNGEDDIDNDENLRFWFFAVKLL